MAHTAHTVTPITSYQTRSQASRDRDAAGTNFLYNIFCSSAYITEWENNDLRHIEIFREHYDSV